MTSEKYFSCPRKKYLLSIYKENEICKNQLYPICCVESKEIKKPTSEFVHKINVFIIFL